MGKNRRECVFFSNERGRRNYVLDFCPVMTNLSGRMCGHFLASLQANAIQHNNKKCDIKHISIKT